MHTKTENPGLPDLFLRVSSHTAHVLCLHWRHIGAAARPTPEELPYPLVTHRYDGQPGGGRWYDTEYRT